MEITNLKLVQKLAQFVHETIVTMAENDTIPLSIKLFDEVAFRIWIDIDEEIKAAKKAEEENDDF